MHAWLGCLADAGPGFHPADIRDAIDALNADIRDYLDLGVHRTGSRKGQADYEDACRKVFKTHDAQEDRMGDGRRFVFGDRSTETDVGLFVTLVRFDPVRHGLFERNPRRLIEHRRLGLHANRVMGLQGVAETVAIGDIKRGRHSNPTSDPGG